jgi:hypothetical protein
MDSDGVPDVDACAVVNEEREVGNVWVVSDVGQEEREISEIVDIYTWFMS